MLERSIYVKFSKEGIHQYPAAGIEPALSDVNFLAYPHRHIFHFRVSIGVVHNDRDIEFIQFKRWLESLYQGGTLELNFRSCEMIAEELYVEISKKYPGRAVEITVSEDDENGATLRWTAS